MRRDAKQKKWFPKKAVFIWLLLGTGILRVSASIPAQSVLETSQQKITITGVVRDKGGETIPGATIQIKGTSVRSISDIDGKYSITVPSDKATLIFSFIGYEAHEEPINGRAAVNPVLSSSVEQLDEVVVTALGIKREKKALGYAMQEVRTEGLSENKSVSVANLLQGKIAGVQISQSGTGVGGSTRVVLRGLSSLSGNNQPLWVVDGFPINDSASETAYEWGNADRAGAASQINPEDIETISVLKGANAAALYGSRAQSGAIIVTTKKGKEGQPLQLEYNGALTLTQAYNSYDYQNVYGQGTGGTFSADSYGSWGPKMEGQMISNWRNTKYGDTRYSSYAMLPQKDYISDFYRTGTNYSNSITATGGAQNITGRFSATDTRNQDITPNHSLNRQYYDLNTEMKNKVLTVGVKLSYMHEANTNAPGQGEYGLMNQFVKMPRSIRLQDLQNPVGTDGYLVNWTGANEAYSNPYGMILSQNGNKSLRDRLIGQISASAHITDYLRLTGRVGMDWYTDDIRGYNEIRDKTSTGSQYSRATVTNKDFNADAILSFDKNFGKFSVSANLGTSVERQTNTQMSGSTGAFVIPGLVTLANGSTITDTESYSQKEIQSVFFNGSVGYKSMVYLDVTGRNDWSSTLPANNRSYFYPSVSLSGILSEMFNLPSQISYLKVRGSWAKVGNDTDPYKLTNSYSLYTSADKVNSDVIKVKLSDTYPLYNLKPEETNSYETGLELQMFKGRLGLDFTYYNSNTVNQILSINMPQSSGYTAKNINAGKIKSSGYEVMLSGTPIKTKDWKWDINLNWGMNRTKCVKLDDEIKQYELGEIRIGKVVVNEGGSMGDIVSIAYKRDAKGHILIDDNGLPETQSDQVIGNMMPKWTGSINNNLQWKNLTFGALVDMRYGGDFISMTDNYACEFGNSTKTLTGRDGMVVSGVSASTGEANTVKTTAEKYYTSIAGPYGVGEAFMYKNTYIKLRELSLGYQLPSLWLKHIFIKSAKITAVARDLFYIYKSAPVNPEGAYTRSDYAQAFELGSTPPVRSFGFAVNLKF